MGRTALFATLPLLHSAAYGYAEPITLYSEPVQTFAALHTVLFPSTSIAPGARAINATGYLMGVLEDDYIAKGQRNYLLKGAVWLNEASRSRYGNSFYALHAQQKETVIKEISQKSWGDNWLWQVMSYLFEAMLCDPVYGANENKAGWDWLGHEPGYPRPGKAIG